MRREILGPELRPRCARLFWLLLKDGPLRDFRRDATLQLRHDLAVRFEAAKSPAQRDSLDETDKDPAEYVKEHTPGA